MDNLEETKATEEPKAAALNTTTAVKLDALEFVTYERNLSRVQHAQQTVQMYEHEHQRAQAELARLGYTHREHLVSMAAKHNVDLNAMMVSEDGFFMPHPSTALRR